MTPVKDHALEGLYRGYRSIDNEATMYKIKADKFQKARGGHTRILKLCCEHCAYRLFAGAVTKQVVSRDSLS